MLLFIFCYPANMDISWTLEIMHLFIVHAYIHIWKFHWKTDAQAS